MKIDQNTSKNHILENFYDNNDNEEDIQFDESDFGFGEKLKFELNDHNSLSLITKQIHENFLKSQENYSYITEPFRRELTSPHEGKRF